MRFAFLKAHSFFKNVKGVIMQPVDPELVESLMSAWYVWASVFVFAFLFTIIGTWLVTRRWEE